MFDRSTYILRLVIHVNIAVIAPSCLLIQGTMPIVLSSSTKDELLP